MSIISISNYESYQGVDTTDRPTDNTTESTSNDTTESTTDGRQIDQQKEQQTVQQIDQQTDANKKNKNNINIILSTNADNISIPLTGNSLNAPAPARNKPVPFKKIQEMWNTTCTSFPKIFNMSENRKNKMRIRLEEMGGEEKAFPVLQALFSKMQESNFLKGDNKRGWKASFDWLFENDKNWVKVHEGNYDNQKPGSGSKPEEPKGRNYDETIF